MHQIVIEQQGIDIRYGRKIKIENQADGLVKMFDENAIFLGIGQIECGYLQPLASNCAKSSPTKASNSANLMVCAISTCANPVRLSSITWAPQPNLSPISAINERI
jgi:hypothetical protein